MMERVSLLGTIRSALLEANQISVLKQQSEKHLIVVARHIITAGNAILTANSMGSEEVPRGII